MLSRLKQYFWIGLVLAGFYYLLAHHFIFFDFKDFETLKKKELTFTHTFFSMKTNTPKQALEVDVLREAGIGEMMVERGLISQERLEQILIRIEAQE